MAARDTSPLSDPGAEPLLEEPGGRAPIAQWRAYTRQQVALARQRPIQPPPPVAPEVPRRSDKPYHIKTIGQAPALYTGESYAEWISHTRAMESQFKANQCDRFADDPDSAKLVYAETFLKRGTTIHMLWEADVTARPDEERTWIGYKDFLKVNVQGASTRVEDTYDKYLDYKQTNKQSVMNYDANRIALMAQLTPELKPNSHEELQNFIRGLLPKHRRFLARERDMHTKIEVLNRLKKIEDADYQDSQHNKQEATETNTNSGSNKRKRDDDNPTNGGEQSNKKGKPNNNGNGNSNGSGGGGKKPKSDNPNRDPVKPRLYRWTRAESAAIKESGRCFGCGKDGHDINACTNKKKCTVPAEPLPEAEKAKN